MKRIEKIALSVLLVLTLIYIGAVMYVGTKSSSRYVTIAHNVLLGAFKYTGEMPPSMWYAPEQLGIVGVIEYYDDKGDISWLHVEVSESDHERLQEEQPIFKYGENFYQVFPGWVTPSLSKRRWQFPVEATPVGVALGVSWLIFGVSVLREETHSKRIG